MWKHSSKKKILKEDPEGWVVISNDETWMSPGKEGNIPASGYNTADGPQDTRWRSLWMESNVGGTLGDEAGRWACRATLSDWDLGPWEASEESKADGWCSPLSVFNTPSRRCTEQKSVSVRAVHLRRWGCDEQEATPDKKRRSSAKTGEHERRVGPQNKQGLEVRGGERDGVWMIGCLPCFWRGELLDGGIPY